MFYSNRDGQWRPWIIGLDGGGLRKLADPPGGAVYTLVSPKGDAIVFISDSGQGVFTAPFGTTASVVTELPNTAVAGKYFSPSDWSPDGAQLAGNFTAASGRPAGVGVYDLGKKTATILSTDETYATAWLPDNRRVVYFRKGGHELVVLDTMSRTRTVVDVRLPGPSITDMFTISPDGRAIYYGAVRAEADIWIVERR